VFVGYGVVAPEKGWNDYAGIDMHGKTALILVNDPDYQQDEPRGPVQRPGDDLLRPLDLQVRGSRPPGRAAALIVHDTYPARTAGAPCRARGPARRPMPSAPTAGPARRGQRLGAEAGRRGDRRARREGPRELVAAAGRPGSADVRSA
jgi:hypothetical protein